MSRLDLLLKRHFDITMAAIGLVLSLPFLIVIGVAIKLYDGGPIFYRANRVGRGGRLFHLWKFRTMVVNADREGPAITAKNDPRITPIGRWLRRTKLDELPQLLNVLMGDMSIVGPRPEHPRYVALYTPEQRQVLNVRPGITSAASLTYRQEEHILSSPDWERIYRAEILPAKLGIDLAYLSQRSFLSDIELILRTILAIYWRYREAFMMLHWLNRNRYILLIDIILIIFGAPLAFLIRLDASPLFVLHLPIIGLFAVTGLIVKPFIYWAFGLYRRFWRYASTGELLLIVAAATVSSLVLTVLFLAIILPYGLIPFFPRSVLVIDWLLQLIFVGGVRFLVRVSTESSKAGESLGQRTRQRRVLIAGAGDAGAMITREIQHNPELGITPVAFVDDNPNKIGKRIHNVPVLSTLDDIPQLAQRLHIDEVIIAMPTVPGRVVRGITRLCEQSSVSSKTMPGMYELISGKVSISQIREVQIDDLLRRDLVEVDETSISSYLEGKRVLITGAGGSIGSELTRQVARYGPSALILLGHGENSIYAISQEMQHTFLDLEIYPCIADVRDARRIEHMFQHYQPQVVFHAAAHKHVPLMEMNVCEAVTNNIIGTRTILEAAQQVPIERFVLISSDKAVDPANIMGATKRVAELLTLDAARRGRGHFVAVRFGNVLGSRGSVVPLFKQQIAQGGPVTITHPDIERFFMTIPEAVHLVIQAGALGQNGEIFVLDMGQPVRIVDLARDLIELSGLEVGQDIDIVFTGLRPGEKLTEKLYADDELIEPTPHAKIMSVKPDGATSLESAHLRTLVEELMQAAQLQDDMSILRRLNEFLPRAELAPQVTDNLQT
jgi:FlaA1/EpsC-like NDP-sugar epimerase/lipopolysaccharide/colanic/teichoic acid biosynthesis glycosyltransferase